MKFTAWFIVLVAIPTIVLAEPKAETKKQTGPLVQKEQPHASEELSQEIDRVFGIERETAAVEDTSECKNTCRSGEEIRDTSTCLCEPYPRDPVNVRKNR